MSTLFDTDTHLYQLPEMLSERIYGKTLYTRAKLFSHKIIKDVYSAEESDYKKHFKFFWTYLHELFHDKWYSMTTRNYCELSPERLNFEAGYFFETKILGGIVDYEDEMLTDEACQLLM